MPTIAIAEHRKKRFCDFADEPKALIGDKTKLDDILNNEIEITGFKVGTTRYSKNKSGKYLTIQFCHNNKTSIVFTGSDVLISQVERYSEQIPFFTTIVKINKYYTFS